MEKIKNISHNELVALLKDTHCCEASIDWVMETGYDLKTAWEKCERGDWMVHFAINTEVNNRVMVGLGGKCAELVIEENAHADSVAAVQACDGYYKNQITWLELSEAINPAFRAYFVNDSNYSYAAYCALLGRNIPAFMGCGYYKECADIARQFITVE